MKKVALFLAGLGFCLMSQAEEPVKNFYFAGYKAVFIPSDTFRVEVGNPELGTRKLKDGILSFTLKDASGKMPKDVVYIYTNDIHRISMSYSELIDSRSVFFCRFIKYFSGSGFNGHNECKGKIFACIGRSWQPIDSKRRNRCA